MVYLVLKLDSEGAALVEMIDPTTAALCEVKCSIARVTSNPYTALRTLRAFAAAAATGWRMFKLEPGKGAIEYASDGPGDHRYAVAAEILSADIQQRPKPISYDDE
jgi:hypothetical protein